MITRMLVAVDGSQNGFRAVDYAREIGARFGSHIILVHAFPHTSDMRSFDIYDRLLGERKYQGQKILDQAREQLGETALEVEEDLLEGPAAEAILAVARTRKIDLIVMGTRGRGSLTELMLGSVSRKIVHHAPCPVMVVR